MTGLPASASKSLISQTKDLLRQETARQKGTGQHFLVDGGVLNQILSAAELSSDDTVIEVGPGPAVLTRAVRHRLVVFVAVERDENLARMLNETLASGRTLPSSTGTSSVRGASTADRVGH